MPFKERDGFRKPKIMIHRTENYNRKKNTSWKDRIEKISKTQILNIRERDHPSKCNIKLYKFYKDKQEKLFKKIPDNWEIPK